MYQVLPQFRNICSGLRLCSMWPGCDVYLYVIGRTARRAIVSVIFHAKAPPPICRSPPALSTAETSITTLLSHLLGKAVAGQPPNMQGFNMGRYVPPDLEGTTSGNKIHKKHALGQRASKLGSQGVLTVRFEMPFPIWCSSCPKPTIIGQGVRFNAEKKRVGNYYTTPIWSFRFRHADCGGTIEMRTDPQNTAYTVTEGGTKRDSGPDNESLVTTTSSDGIVSIPTAAEREALRQNAFASLEKTIEDRERLLVASQRIEELVSAQAKSWADPYTANQKLRRAFRAGRKQRDGEAQRTQELQHTMGLGIDLLPGTEDDAKRAAQIAYGTTNAGNNGGGDGEEEEEQQGKTPGTAAALEKPLFGEKKIKTLVSSSSLSSSTGGKRDLAATILGNTRAVQDPFLQSRRPAVTAKKRVKVQHKSALVEYDSD